MRIYIRRLIDAGLPRARRQRSDNRWMEWTLVMLAAVCMFAIFVAVRARFYER